MLWAALLFPCGPGGTPPPPEALFGPATWALQFTPRVAVSEEAVLMEVEASTRLFGGRRALRNRVAQEGTEQGVTALAWASSSLAAQCLARAGIENGFKRPLDVLLDGLAFNVLSATAPHHTTLAHLGCRTLGDIRRLPRGGIARRFDAALLAALDRAYGLRPEVHAWQVLPERFHVRLQLPARVEQAEALLFAARRLLLQLCGWLAARHAGTTAFTLHWVHDSMRAKEAGEGGQLTVRTAQPMRSVEHLSRLLAEHLAHTPLLAPVGELALEALDVVALEEASGELFPDAARHGEDLALVLERVAARLGPERVRRPQLQDDHRLEWAQHWQPAATPMPRAKPSAPTLPQPTFVLAEPLKLAVRDHRPLYQGPLHLLTGPHRVEAGWWHRVVAAGEQTTRLVVRDYWVALSQHAGVLWVFQERMGGEASAEPAGSAGSTWYLHGSFA